MNGPSLSASAPRPARDTTVFGLLPTGGWRDELGPQIGNESPIASADREVSAVKFLPAGSASRYAAAWRGFRGEIVRISTREAFECEYRGPSHLLIAYQRAARENGDSALDDLPRSTLHDLSGKLTLVPAGSWFRERQDPSGPVQATYLYIEAHGPLMDADAGCSAGRLTPRLLFDNDALWGTALKLARQVEAGSSAWRAYAEALGVVLVHELLQLDGRRMSELPAQGGLADWQRRIVIEYIEENLADQISLAKLAELVRLSPYHFARAFKKTIGMPPRRYHMHRRIERARMLLAEPNLSVTEIADRVGFADTSSFSVAFHTRVGRSPRAYRRSLG